jgi:hypothetical protein
LQRKSFFDKKHKVWIRKWGSGERGEGRINNNNLQNSEF